MKCFITYIILFANIIRIIKLKRMMSREYSTHGEKMNTCRVLLGKTEGKRPLRRSRRSLEDNIKIDLKEIGWGGMDWNDLAQDRDQ
jgi:hypothetical protein